MENQWLELANKMAEDTYEAVKKLNETNVKTMQNLVEKQASVMTSCLETAQENMEKLAAVKDYKELATVQGEIMRTCGEKVLSNYKDVMSMVGEARDEVSGLVNENIQTAESNLKKAASTAKKAA